MKKNGKLWSMAQKVKGMGHASKRGRRKGSTKEGEERLEEKNEEIKYPFKTSPELCAHFHREDVDEETGLKQNLPAEEFWIGAIFHEFPSWRERIAGFEVKKSDLVAVSATQCKCRTCGKMFSIDAIDQMQKLFDRINELGRGSSPLLDIQFMKLCEGIEPVWYRKVYLEEQDYVVYDKYETEVEVEWCPTKWECYTRDDHYQIWDTFLDKTPINNFHRLPEDKRRDYHCCAHYFGLPHILYKVPLYNGGFMLKRVGGIGHEPNDLESYLITSPDGKCRCRFCKMEFDEGKQKQLERLMRYLNTPHYRSIEDIAELSEQEQNEWKQMLNHYNYGYAEEDEPFTVFDVNKAVELTKGIEPVFCKNGSFIYNPKPAKILSVLRWKNGAWVRK